MLGLQGVRQGVGARDRAHGHAGKEALDEPALLLGLRHGGAVFRGAVGVLLHGGGAVPHAEGAELGHRISAGAQAVTEARG